MDNPNPWRPDPNDGRIPIGPGDVITSMNRRRASGRQAPAPVQRQTFENCFDVFGLRVRAEGLDRQTFSFVEQLVSCAFVHVGSLAGAAMRVHSYFPSVSRLSWCMSPSSSGVRLGAMSTSRSV